MKTAIVYYSKHHGNTKRVIDAIVKNTADEVTLFDVTQDAEPDLSGYDRIGFASGIYYSKFHKSVIEAAGRLPPGARVFLLYTCGAKKDGYTRAMEAAVSERSAQMAGAYGCLGFDTFGPFKLIGGIAKGHPDQDDLAGAVQFYSGLAAE